MKNIQALNWLYIFCQKVFVKTNSPHPKNSSGCAYFCAECKIDQRGVLFRLKIQRPPRGMVFHDTKFFSVFYSFVTPFIIRTILRSFAKNVFLRETARKIVRYLWSWVVVYTNENNLNHFDIFLAIFATLTRFLAPEYILEYPSIARPNLRPNLVDDLVQNLARFCCCWAAWPFVVWL